MKLVLAMGALILGTSNSLYAAGLPDIEAAVMNKDYSQVRLLASQVIQNSKDFSERTQAQYYVGLAQLRLGQYVQARHTFGLVMDARPPEGLYDRAAIGTTEAYYMEGSYKQALDELENLLKTNSHAAFLSLIYLKIAHCDLKLMRWEKANEVLNKILMEFPDSPEAPLAKQLLEEKQYFAVQVGSFLDKDRALKLINDLKAGGEYAYVVETTAPDGQKFYRVRVGQMSSLKEAQDLKEKISKLGYPSLIYP